MLYEDLAALTELCHFKGPTLRYMTAGINFVLFIKLNLGFGFGINPSPANTYKEVGSFRCDLPRCEC